MRTHLIDYVLWCTTPAVATAISAHMLRGRLQRKFPFFFNFVVFQIAAFAVEFSLRNLGYYYYVYWVIFALGILISCAVLVEILQRVVGGAKPTQYFNIALFDGFALVLVVLVAVVAVRQHTASEYLIDKVTTGVFLVDRTVRIAQCALALLMVLFGATVGISRRNLAFGIAIGYGFFAVVDLVVMVLLSHRAAVSRVMLSRVNAVAYLISLLIWLVYVAATSREAASRPMPGTP